MSIFYIIINESPEIEAYLSRENASIEIFQTRQYIFIMLTAVNYALKAINVK